MVDILLMRHLLAALAPGSRLVLVGDVDQLPSVGPGNVLRDLIDSGRVRTVRLTEIYRQARESRIVVNAHRVNEGRMPLFEEDASDFRLVEIERGEDALAWIKRFLAEEIRERYGLDPVRDVQVIAPMHRGIAGVTNLNRELQALLNPRGEEIRRDEKILRMGDKVIQLRNNYELDVFNGDVGRITAIDPEEEKLEVFFGNRRVRYPFNHLDELTLAYAVSVHKSQGSEYRAVVAPLLGEHFPMLQRNLLYTAITRGRELVVLLGSQRTIGAAVRNNRIRHRYSFLAHRLRGAAGRVET
jgi:exodeoxyribonuclease V alpha subunit